MNKLRRIKNSTNNSVLVNGIYIGPQSEINLSEDALNLIDKQYFISGILIDISDFEDNSESIDRENKETKTTRRRRNNTNINTEIVRIEEQHIIQTPSFPMKATLMSSTPIPGSGTLDVTQSYYIKPTLGIPMSDLDSNVQSTLQRALRATLSGQIQITDLSPSLQNQINQLIDNSPSNINGILAPFIPIQKTSLSGDVLNDLSLAQTAYQKPSTGVPFDDLDLSVQAQLQTIDGARYWLEPVDNTMMLPLENNKDGDIRLSLVDNTFWRWDENSTSWQQVGSSYGGIPATPIGATPQPVVPVMNPNISTAVLSEFFANDGQTVVKFSTTYPFGMNQLMVWLNGILVHEGKEYDYIEIDNSTIQFNFPLTSNDYVVCSLSSGSGSGYVLTQIIDITSSINQIKSQYAFVPDTNSIRVFLNGMQLTSGTNDDYVEIDSQTIGFNIDLLPGDRVAFRLETNSVAQNVMNQIAAMKEIYLDLSNKVSNLQKQFNQTSNK